jgi:hypothetical protein
MINYLAAIVSAMLSTLAMASLSAAAGFNMIGYDLESRVIVSLLFGFVVGALGALPRLINPRRFSSFLSIKACSVCVAFLIWFGECLLLPGTNAGFSWKYGLIAVLLGYWLGIGMWLFTPYRKRLA